MLATSLVKARKTTGLKSDPILGPHHSRRYNYITDLTQNVTTGKGLRPLFPPPHSWYFLRIELGPCPNRVGALRWKSSCLDLKMADLVAGDGRLSHFLDRTWVHIIG